MDVLTQTLEEYGMKINIKKTKMMRMKSKGEEQMTCHLTVLQQMKKFISSVSWKAKQMTANDMLRSSGE